MAISKGKESRDTVTFPKYVGVCPVTIIAINPNKAKYEELFNTTLTDEPVYIDDYTDSEGQTYKRLRLNFILKPALEEDMPIPLINMALFIQHKLVYNKDKTKVQVIDKYGRTGWVTLDMVKSHTIPFDKNGNPLNLDADYRPVFVGEEDLTKLIKTFLCIDEVLVWDRDLRKWVFNSKVNPADCECRIDNFATLFSGNISPITEALSFQPNNKIKVMLGVRIMPDSGQLFQTVYTHEFLHNSATNYKRFSDAIQNIALRAAAQGKALSYIYKASPVEEYKVVPTDITPSVAAAPIDDPLLDKPNPDDLPW